MRKFLAIFTILCCASLRGQSRLEQMINSSKALEGAFVGVLAVTQDIDTLASYNCGKMFQPASTMKLVTTGCALSSLGDSFRFKTEIGYRGEISADGVLEGDVVIRGGGDPLLCYGEEQCEETFLKWKSFLSKAGIRKINGRIIGDGSWLGGTRENQTWLYEDVGTGYGTGMSGLSFWKNQLRIYVKSGEKVGAPLTFTQLYPMSPWLEISYDCCTGEKSTGDQLYMFTGEKSTEAVIRGTFAIDKGHKTVLFSNKYPEYTLASEFCEWLEHNGIPCSGSYAEPYPYPDYYTPNRSELISLGIIESCGSLSEIVFDTNQSSDNFYADCIFRTLGRQKGGDGSYESGAKAIREILSGMGVSTTGLKITDGSGLSRNNLLTPSFFCRYLCAMEESPAYGSFLRSLPQPGVSGTVSGRLSKLDAAKRARVRMKSGSMDGVCCYCGYIMPATKGGDTVAFSVMVNNFSCSIGKVNTAIDEIISAIMP